MPGVVRNGSWVATYVGVPPEGVLFKASFDHTDGRRLGQPLLLVTSSRLPGGAGWQSLPAWLPQQTAVWSAAATWVVRPDTGPAIAPVPPLR